ncbi:gamma-glutamyl-gamma-aminobutyrate hydrolase family protein [Streptomyces sp. NPDC097595]|uniref:gamma-glutamyl-gamma-aminobutyrate hydrolase family protein n=1 Tax=Streptomyces sp. NPDC097595 TaxID=3366090 RepID=UPI003819A33C
MTEPIIGISLRPWRRPGKTDRWMQSIGYFHAVQHSGAVPLGIAPVPEPALRALYGLCAALVLPGGMDIAPELYGDERRTTTEIQPELDAMELTLLRWAREDGKPVLGVCRGAQLLNAALGGALWQDLPAQRGVRGHGGDDGAGTEFHDIVVADGSRLREVTAADRILVNSRHHQAVSRLGTGLKAVAHAPDGVVEAIEADGPWFALGVQWHPEELPTGSPVGGGVFRALTRAAATSARVVAH